MRNPFRIGKRAVWIGAVAAVALIAGRAQAQQAAPTSPQPVAQPTPAEPPRILPEEVKALAAKGKVLIVDVRDKASYDFEHAEGAISVPLRDIETRLLDLPKDKQIAAYCTWTSEHTSARAAQILIDKGYRKVAALKGGLAGWKAAGGKTVSSNK